MEQGRRATTEELLADAGWVRALSPALVPDPHAALDLEQDAWGAALAHPPRAGDGLRGWWARVVRHEATDEHRARSRRAQREAEARTDQDTPPPFETNAALDVSFDAHGRARVDGLPTGAGWVSDPARPGSTDAVEIVAGTTTRGRGR